MNCTLKYLVNSFRRTVMQRMTHNIGSSFSNQSGKLSQTDEIRKILIIRPNSRLGNQLLISPLLQEIESTLPNAKIDLFVRGNLAPILFSNYNNINRIIKLPPKPFKQLPAYIKTWVSLLSHSYDLVFNVDAGSSSGRLSTKLSRGRCKCFGERNAQLDLTEEYQHMGRWPVYNFRLFLSAIGLRSYNNPIPSLSLQLSTTEKENGKLILERLVQNKRPTIMLYTFATGAKCLSKEWWSNFYSQLKEYYGNDYNILEVLPKEKVSQIDFAATSYYSTDIREMGAVISNGAIFITGDCGVMHLASSVNIPTVGLFSTTNIDTYKPYNKGSFALYASNIDTGKLLQKVYDVLNKTSLIIANILYMFIDSL
ncbi:MAG: ADP-heptose:LPS heptosyltransferase-like protein [Bacteroidetes bacterium]|nr:ADP-heptose:LPS heptosyltransferase-like protein [Bacteroidota bacterium]